MDIVGNYQAGFKAGQSTTDQIFTIRQVLEKYREYDRESWHLLIDFKQAYDSVSRASMWTIMREMGIPGKLTRLCRVCYEHSRCMVRVGGEKSREFEVVSGLRQGCPLSPTLFNIALEWIIRRVTSEGGVKLLGNSIGALAYADDVDLIGESLHEIDAKAREFVTEAGRVGLKVNEGKTKIVHAVRGEPDGPRVVSCGGMNIEVVPEFKYLGSIITSNDEVSREISARIAAGKRCVGGLKRVLSSRKVSRKTKVRVYTVIVRPVALYASETWRFTKQMERRLEVFKNGVLRQICGPVREAGVWRRRHNEELRELTGVPWITDIIKSNRLRWAGHVARQEEDAIPKIAMRGRPEGRRPVGRPRKRWRDGVMQDLRQMGHDGDWMETAQNRERWRTVVAAARGLHGLQPAE